MTASIGGDDRGGVAVAEPGGVVRRIARLLQHDFVEPQPQPGAVVVECKGEHDLTTEIEMDQLLVSLVAESDLVVVDVSEAEFVDSSFLHSLVKADRASRARGSRVLLQFGTAPIVRRAFEISGVLEHLEHVATREEALSAGHAHA